MSLSHRRRKKLEKFKIKITPSGQRDLKGLDLQVRLKILKALEVLRIQPLPSGSRVKRIKRAKEPLYRLRYRDYRIIFRVQAKEVVILAILHRRDLEKKLREIT